MDSITFMIPSMVTEDVEVINTGIEQIDGVHEVRIHMPTRSVTVTWSSPATLDDIKQRMIELNFTPDYPQGF